MKCGRDWMLHPRWPSKHPACDRGNIEQDAHNAADWIARITQLERDLSDARRERDEARAQLDTYIKTAAEAVAEQGRMEVAGRVLAAEVYDFAAAFAFDTGQEVLTHVSEDVKSNPLTLAWVRQAQEASNGN